VRTDPTPNEAFSSGRGRRTHSAEFKAQVVAACRVAGVSKAAVAMAHGVNANLARRWVVEADGRSDSTSIASVNLSSAVEPAPTPIS
jgi:transposase-like protein